MVVWSFIFCLFLPQIYGFLCDQASRVHISCHPFGCFGGSMPLGSACANLCECFILDGEKPVKMINCVVAPVPWKIRSPLTTFFEHLFSTQHIFAAAAKSLQSCPTLCDPRDGSPPGSPVPGILQARTLEWVAISFSSAWKWKWSRSVVSDS